MRAEVIDASALAALLFGEPGAAHVAERLEGAELYAPSLVRYELASVFLKKLRAYPSQSDSLRAALDLYPRLGVTEASVPVVGLSDLAQRAGVTAYDAAYLWLAWQAGAPLLTLDASLGQAAERLGVPTTP